MKFKCRIKRAKCPRTFGDYCSCSYVWSTVHSQGNLFQLLLLRDLITKECAHSNLLERLLCIGVVTC